MVFIAFYLVKGQRRGAAAQPADHKKPWFAPRRLAATAGFRFKVLKGEMAIAGPRPERPEFVKTLSEKIPYYRSGIV